MRFCRGKWKRKTETEKLKFGNGRQKFKHHNYNYYSHSVAVFMRAYNTIVVSMRWDDESVQVRLTSTLYTRYAYLA